MAWQTKIWVSFHKLQMAQPNKIFLSGEFGNEILIRPRHGVNAEIRSSRSQISSMENDKFVTFTLLDKINRLFADLTTLLKIYSDGNAWVVDQCPGYHSP